MGRYRVQNDCFLSEVVVWRFEQIKISNGNHLFKTRQITKAIETTLLKPDKSQPESLRTLQSQVETLGQ